MNRNWSIYKISALAVLTVSLLVSVIRIGVVEKNIEIDSTGGYFIARNSETIGFVIFSACFALAFCVLAFIIGKKADKLIDMETSPVVFSSALCGFMLMSTGLYYSYMFLTTDNMKAGKFAISLMMILASVMFLYLALAKNGMKKHIIPFMRLIPAMYAIVRLLVDFVEQNSRPGNSAVVFHIMSLMLLMLFMVYEGKTSFGTTAMRTYLGIGYLCMFTMLLYSVPNLYITIRNPQLDKYILFSAVDIVLALYVFTRVYSVTREKSTSDG
ncbi:MAG: hypothetical protein PHW77_05425 [Eubacteriales bacterium]|nr:hypothetical protein [Eubacteriales bacterium]